MGDASVWSAGACRDTCTRPRDTARILLSRAWRRPAFPSIWVAQRCISRLAGPFDAAAARRAFFAARFSRASKIIVSHIGQKIQQISSCSPRAAPVLRTGGAISSGDRRPTSSRLGFSRPALSKYRRASAGVHRSMSSLIARRSVPVQPCFMLASAFRVAYGEAGMPRVECGTRSNFRRMSAKQRTFFVVRGGHANPLSHMSAPLAPATSALHGCGCRVCVCAQN